MGKTIHIKIGVAALFAFLLGVAYAFFSYQQFLVYNQQRDQSLWDKTQNKVTQAITVFQQYLGLTKERIKHISPKVDKIPSILSFRMDIFHKSFPELLTMSFIPQNSPKTSYSRLGARTLEIPFVIPPKDRVTYLGNGSFHWEKLIYDKGKQLLGTLETEFTLAPFLYEHFSKQDVQVLPFSQKSHDFRSLSFSIPSFPYNFILKSQRPSFSNFLLKFKEHILLIFFFMCLTFLVGMLLSRILVQKQLRTSHIKREKLQENSKKMEEQSTVLKMRVEFLNKLVEQKDIRHLTTRHFLLAN